MDRTPAELRQALEAFLPAARLAADEGEPA
jgi:hypothetical protein